MRANIKYGTTTLKTVTGVGTTTYATSGKYMNNNFAVEVVEGGVDTSDATATADKIVASKTAYIADESKATGTIPVYSGSHHTVATPTLPNYLCFTANTAGSTVTCSKFFDYSYDGTCWYVSSMLDPIVLTNAGDHIYVRSGSVGSPAAGLSLATFTLTGSIAASGNIMSLVDNTCTTTTIPDNACFAALFKNQTALTSAPELPATTLTMGCYYEMFYGTSITTPPVLPASVVPQEAYCYMFANTPITTLPELNVTDVGTMSLQHMFDGCTNVGLFITSGTGHTNAWRLPTTGSATFATAADTQDMFANTGGSISTPASETTYYYGTGVEETDYLCFTANTTGSTVTCPLAYEYSPDRNNWSTASTSSAITLTNVGDKIYLRKGNATVSAGCGTFTMSGSIAASGNVMSLVDNSVTSTSMEGFSFSELFKGCAALTSAPKLPATTLQQWCYYGMFQDCTNLTAAPTLPALSVPEYAYAIMFHSCTSLVSIPNLPATTLGDHAYESMFVGTAITSACSIAATTLGASSLEGMFAGCTNLNTVAKLHATNYPSRACYYMYGECNTYPVSETQGGEYQYEWRVPTSGTGYITGTETFDCMFLHSVTWSDIPVTVNTTFYAKNPPV